MAKTHTLRIGVGTPETPFVPVWRIWTQKSETYLAGRDMAGLQKVSLHSSGVWTAAFTEQSGVELRNVQNRRSHRWERPPAFVPGWVQGPVIDISRVDTRHLPFPPHAEKKPITWLPAPQVRHKLQIAVLFATDPSASADDLRYGEAIGSLPLDNGETVWIVASETAMTRNDRRQSFRVRDVEVGFGGATISGAPIEAGKVSAAVVWITTSPDGPPMLVQVPLGSHNFRRVEVIDRQV